MNNLTTGVDVGGNKSAVAIYQPGHGFLTGELVEHPSRMSEGPTATVAAVRAALEATCQQLNIDLSDIRALTLDYPGPASRTGQMSKKGSTNFPDPAWRSFNLCEAVAKDLGIPVGYANDGDLANNYAHHHHFGTAWRSKTSVGFVVGTGLGGGIIYEGKMIQGARGFGAELGHIAVPTQLILPVDFRIPVCGCGRQGDLESIASLTGIIANLLPEFLKQFPGHELEGLDVKHAAKLLKTRDPQTDALACAIFSAQAVAIAYAFDELINVFDPDVLFLGGGLFENTEAFNLWFFELVRQTLREMPGAREEQMDIPLVVIPDVDNAACRGGALLSADAYEA